MNTDDEYVRRHMRYREASVIFKLLASAAQRRIQAEQRNRQPQFRGQHLDAELWEGIPRKDLRVGYSRDAAGSCFRYTEQWS